MRLSFIASLSSAAALVFWYGDVSIGRDQIAWARAHLSPNEPVAAEELKFLTAVVEKGELRRVVTASGTLNAILNVEVGSQLSGQIAELLVDFNDEVKKGQPLARLDQRSLQARVSEAEAALDLAEGKVNIARVRLERARIDAQDTEAQRPVLSARTDYARVKLDAARSELGRKEILRERQIGSTVDLEDARNKLSAAEANLREAQAVATAHEHKVAGSRSDVERADAELQTALASLQQNKALLQVGEIDLERTTIRSPIDGVVVGRNVNQGQTLATTLEAKTLFVIAGDLQQMEIHAKVDEADIGKIAVDQEATFGVDAHPGRQFRGRVRQVRKAPQVQQSVVAYTVVLSAANPESLLLPGMTALARIATDRSGPTLKLPLAALRYAPKADQGTSVQRQEVARGRPFTVWIAGPGGEARPITVGLGEEDSSHAALVSGPLEAGDRIIIGDVAPPAPRQLLGIRIGL